MSNKYQEALDKLYDGYKNGMAGRHYYDILQELVDKEKGIKPFKESLADRLCGKCGCYINYDALNESVENAPKYCVECGTKILWEEVKK